VVQFLADFTDFLRKNNENIEVESIYVAKVKIIFDKNVSKPQLNWFSDMESHMNR